MQKKVVVYRMVGDPEMGGAAIDGMMTVVQPARLDDQQMQLVKDELAATKAELKETQAELGVKRPRESKDFQKKMRKCDKKFKVKQRSSLFNKLLGIYAFVWLVILGFYEKQLRIWKGEE